MHMTAAKDTGAERDDEARLAEFETLAREAIESVARSMETEFGTGSGPESGDEYGYIGFSWLIAPSSGTPVRLWFARGEGRDAGTYGLFRTLEFDKSAVIGDGMPPKPIQEVAIMYPLTTSYDQLTLTTLVNEAAHKPWRSSGDDANSGVVWFNEFTSAVNDFLRPIASPLQVTCEVEMSIAPDEYVVIGGHRYRWLVHLGIRPKGTGAEFHAGFIILDDNSIKAAISDKLNPKGNAKSDDSIAFRGPIDTAQITAILEPLWLPLQQKLKAMLPASN